jgi:putative transposase
VIEHVDAHRRDSGLEPTCAVLQVAPRTYYAAKARPPSTRSVKGAELSQVLTGEHEASYGVYWARKIRKVLH